MNMSAMQDSPGSHRQNLLLAALSYAVRGWRVFPLQPNNKIPFRGTRGFHDATTDEAQIRAWWAKWPRANIGVATGEGLVVIDEDTYKGADAAAWMLPVTLTAQTARGGRHWYFDYDGVLSSVPEGKLAKGICIKASGGYVVAEPSTYEGKPYTFDDLTQPLAQLPERIAKLIRGDLQEQRQGSIGKPPRGSAQDNSSGEYWVDKALEQARAKGRNNAGIWLAQQLVWNDCIDPDGAMRYYAHLVEDWDTPYYTEREALASLNQARKHQKREPARSQALPRDNEPVRLYKRADEDGEYGRKYSKSDSSHEPPQDSPADDDLHCTDMGNARRFVRHHAQAIRHVGLWGHWMVWDGRRWQHDWTGEASRLAKRTVRSIYKEAEEETLDVLRKDLAKWAVRSESRERLTALLAVAQSEPELARTPEAFDMQPWLLNVNNGILDLRTGRLVAHDSAYGITRLAPVDYDPNAICPTWLAFLNRIMAGNQRLISFLQRAVGYSLTDDTTAQVLFLLHGSGANGKSRFLEAIEGVLGDYGMSTPTSTLMAKRDNNIPNDVARLKGARFVKAIETEEGNALAESLVKQMTGGDMITARFMRGEWFDFKPAFKLWLAANHLPTIRGTDDGIWRRIRYIPFEVQIPDGEKDEHLGDKLRSEYPGILAWAVRGCLEWQRDGLGYPDEVRAATQDYRDTMNHFGRFIEDCCVLDKTAGISAKLLRKTYEDWCAENGERAWSQVRVGRELQSLKVRRQRGNDGATVYEGICLRSQLPQ